MAQRRLDTRRRPSSAEAISRVVKGRNRDTAWYAIIDEWPAVRDLCGSRRTFDQEGTSAQPFRFGGDGCGRRVRRDRRRLRVDDGGCSYACGGGRVLGLGPLPRTPGLATRHGSCARRISKAAYVLRCAAPSTAGESCRSTGTRSAQVVRWYLHRGPGQRGLHRQSRSRDRAPSCRGVPTPPRSERFPSVPAGPRTRPYAANAGYVRPEETVLAGLTGSSAARACTS
jgi:hypothetical protein